MGIIRKMVELLAAAGFEVHDVTRSHISRGAGFTRDEYVSGMELLGRPDPPGVVSSNRRLIPDPPPVKPCQNKMLVIGAGKIDFYDTAKPKAIKVDAIGTNVPVDKRRGRPRKSATPLHKSKRPPSLFDLFRRLKGGEK